MRKGIIGHMLLAIDIGNTNVTLGVFADESLVATARVATEPGRMADEYGLTLSDAHDVTAHTLPTYDFLRKIVEEWNNKADAEQFIRATGLLEEASRRGFISYRILRFIKR